MKEQIKALRVEIDGLAQLCEGLKPITTYNLEQVDVPSVVPGNVSYLTQVQTVTRKGNTNEIKEAIKSLKLSKAWLGKVLESLGSDNPYGSGYKTVEDIVPETDKVTGVPLTIQEAVDYNKMSHIEKVDWLREEIKAVIQRLSNTILYNEFGVSNGELSTIYLQEARFWLGFELGRVRDESN